MREELIEKALRKTVLAYGWKYDSYRREDWARLAELVADLNKSDYSMAVILEGLEHVEKHHPNHFPSSHIVKQCMASTAKSLKSSIRVKRDHYISADNLKKYRDAQRVVAKWNKENRDAIIAGKLKVKMVDPDIALGRN